MMDVHSKLLLCKISQANPLVLLYSTARSDTRSVARRGRNIPIARDVHVTVHPLKDQKFLARVVVPHISKKDGWTSALLLRNETDSLASKACKPSQKATRTVTVFTHRANQFELAGGMQPQDPRHWHLGLP